MAKKEKQSEPVAPEPVAVEVTADEPSEPRVTEIAHGSAVTSRESLTGPGARTTTLYGSDIDPSILTDASPEALADYFYAKTNPRFRALPRPDVEAKVFLVKLFAAYRAHLTKKPK